MTRFLLIFHMLNALSVLHFLECTEDDTANIRERTANIDYCHLKNKIKK